MALALWGCAVGAGDPSGMDMSAVSEQGSQVRSEASEQIPGGMDGAGNIDLPTMVNTADSGDVVTTMGTFLVDVRSTSSLKHIFQEGQSGIDDRTFLTHQVIAEDGRSLNFELDYLEGTQSFQVAERGFIAITEDGEELYGKTGTVTISPGTEGEISVTVEGLSVGPSNSNEQTRWIGDGVVSGPVDKVCMRASEVRSASPEEAASENGSEEARLDHEHVQAFCSD